MGDWCCPCCEPVPFDPVPLVQHCGHRDCRPALRASPCTSSASTQPDDLASRRNVIAKGLARFEAHSELPSQPDWEQLSDRVLSVLGQNPSSFTLNGTNCYLVGTGVRRILIDTGDEFFGSESFLNSLAQCFEEFGIEGLEAIVITHMHHDHYGNIGRLQARYGPVPVHLREMPEDSFPILKELEERDQLHHFLGADGKPAYNPRQDSTPWTLSEQVDLSWADDRVQLLPGKDTSAKLQYLLHFLWHQRELVERLRCGDYPWQPLSEGSVICTEGATLKALHMPGHAEDHMCFVLEEEHSLFSGDHVLGWGTTMILDMKDYMESLRRMLQMQPVRLYPGHGRFLEDGVDILSRYITHREMREQQAWKALVKRSEPVTLEEVARELYPEVTRDRLWMARSNVEVLFRKFVSEGAAAVWKRSFDSDGVEQLVMTDIPSAYKVRNLAGDFLWAARRSLVSNL